MRNAKDRPPRPVVEGRGRKPAWQKFGGVQRPLLAELEASCEDYIRNATSAATHKIEKTAMRSFAAFQHDYFDSRPELFMQPESAYDMESSVYNEITFCLFAVWMDTIGLASSTVCTYVSLVKTKMQHDLGFPLMLEQWQFRLPRLLKGIKKLKDRVRKGRLGFRAVHHRRMRELFNVYLDEEEELIDTMLSTGRETLARSVEMVPNAAKEFDGEHHMTVGDISFKVTDEGVEYVQVMLRPVKKGSKATCKMPVPLQKGDGLCDAYSSLKRYLAGRRRREGELDDDGPLFVLKGETVCTGHLRAYIQTVARALGLDPKLFGAHSLRIGGGTDHFVAGTPAIILQIAGRWDSDIFQDCTQPCLAPYATIIFRGRGERSLFTTPCILSFDTPPLRDSTMLREDNNKR